MGDRLMRLAVGVVVGVWMARSLGPSLFGTYSFAVAALILAMPLATLGLEALVVRELVAGAPRDETLGTVFVLRLAAGLLAGFLAVGTVFLARGADRVVVALVSLVSCQLAFQAFDVVDLWCQSQLLSRLTVLAKGAAFLCASGLRVLLLVRGAGVVAFGWAVAFEMGLGALLLTVVFLRRGGRFQFRASRVRAGELLRQSWPFLLSGVAIIVYMRIDQFMLGLILGDSAVGIYSAALRISELWCFVSSAVVISASPAILQAKSTDEALYRRRLQHLFHRSRRSGLRNCTACFLARGANRVSNIRRRIRSVGARARGARLAGRVRVSRCCQGDLGRRRGCCQGHARRGGGWRIPERGFESRPDPTLRAGGSGGSYRGVVRRRGVLHPPLDAPTVHSGVLRQC